MSYYTVEITNGTKTTVIDDGDRLRVAGGKIVKQINGIDSFTFTMYHGNPGYNLLTPKQTMVSVKEKQSGKEVFFGRYLKATDSMEADGKISKSVICQGLLGWLSDTVQPYGEYTAAAGVRTILERFITEHNSQAPAKAFRVGAVNVTGENGYTYTTNWQNTVDAIKTKLIEKFGGEIQVRKATESGQTVYYIDYLKQIGVTSTTAIELAVNLQSVSQDIDATSIITRLYPLGAKLEGSEDRVKISSVNGGKPYIENTTLKAKYGLISGTMIWNDVTTPAALMSKATAAMNSGNKIKTQYMITALDLSKAGYDFQSFGLGNSYPIKNSLMGINDTLRVIGLTIDLDVPYQSQLTVGDKFATLTGLTATNIASLNAKIDNIVVEQKDFASEIVAKQTALIRGADGGCVYQRLDPTTGLPMETIYLNEASIEASTHALRINNNGIGFWSGQAGGALTGEYTKAWTIDGTFNTDYIFAEEIAGVKFNNANGDFQVKEDGTLIAKKALTYNLRVTNAIMQLSGMDDYIQFILSSQGGGGYIRMHHAGLEAYTTQGTGLAFRPASIIGAESGDTKFKIQRNGQAEFVSVYANDVYIKQNDSDTGYISLRTYIANHP